MAYDKKSDSAQLKKGGQLSAVVLLAIVVVTLVAFNVNKRVVNQPAKNTDTTTNKKAPDLGNKAPDFFERQLEQVISATKKAPFKAKVVTDGGFYGFWTQSGDNYRFESPPKLNLIIINSSKKKVWVVNLTRKVALETPISSSTASFYSELSPAFFIEGLSRYANAETKRLEDILPSDNNSKLMLTKQGLPKRWEGLRSNKTPCFISWDYIQINNISPAEFELPKGIAITPTPPSQIATATAVNQ
ncbi:MAG: hypothetical protein ACYC56_01320 [Candidatus Aquicultor sp.]